METGVGIQRVRPGSVAPIMPLLLWLFCASLCWGLGPGACQPIASPLFDPEKQAHIQGKGHGITIDLTSARHCPQCSGRVALEFQVRDNADGKTRTFEIRNDTAQADQIFLVSRERAIIVGSVNGTTRIINIVNLARLSVEDSFLCLRPTISPDCQILAYVRSFTLHFAPPSEWSYVYLAYEPTQSPGWNRLSSSTEERDVGIPFYPPENAQRGVYRPFASTEADAHLMASTGFSWLSERLLAFVDRQGMTSNLVVVNFSSGVRRTRAKAYAIDPDAVIDFSRCKGEVGNAAARIFADQISMANRQTGLVRLALHPFDCLRSSHLDILVPESAVPSK